MVQEIGPRKGYQADRDGGAGAFEKDEAKRVCVGVRVQRRRRQTKRLRQGDYVSTGSYSTAAYNVPQILSDAQNHHYFLRLLGYTFLRFWFTHGCVAFAFAVELLRLYVRLLVLLLLVLVLGSCGAVEGRLYTFDLSDRVQNQLMHLEKPCM